MKLRFVVPAFFVAFASSSQANQFNSDPFQPGPYLAGGYQAWFPDYKYTVSSYLPTILNGGEIEGGWRFNRYYTVELGYSYATGFGSGSYVQLTVQSINLDGLGYLPLGHGSPLALYGDVGVSEMSGNVNVPIALVNGSQSKFGPHVGGGIQYQINEDLGIRAGGRYQWATFDDINGGLVATLSVVWRPF